MFLPQIKIGGQNKRIAESFIKINGTPRKIKHVYIKVGGKLQEVSGTRLSFVLGSNLTLSTAVGRTTKKHNVGATTINLDKTTGFSAGQQIVIYDAVGSESLVVNKVTQSAITVSATKRSYNGGAVVARSTVELANGKFLIPQLITYKVTSKML